MDNELILNFIFVISTEGGNLKNIIHQISQAGKPDLEMTFTKAICKK